jgi:hypothetical protein
MPLRDNELWQIGVSGSYFSEIADFWHFHGLFFQIAIFASNGANPYNASLTATPARFIRRRNQRASCIHRA